MRAIIKKAKKETSAAAAADHRHLSAKIFITNVAAKEENDQWESARKLAQAHDMSIKTIHATLHRV